MSQEKKPFPILASELCLASPIVAYVIGMGNKNAEFKSGPMFIPTLQGLIIIAGITLGIIALIGLKKYDKSKILGKALAGLICNLVIVGLVVSGYIVIQGKKSKDSIHSNEVSKMVVLEQGWLGSYIDEKIKVVITPFPNESEPAKKMNSLFSKNISTTQVGIVNQSNYTVVAEAINVKIEFSDGTITHSIPIDDVLDSAMKEKDKLKQTFIGPHTIQPEEMFYDFMIFLPYEFSWEGVKSVIIIIDGKEIEVRGRIYSEAEKNVLYQQSIDSKSLLPEN